MREVLGTNKFPWTTSTLDYLDTNELGALVGGEGETGYFFLSIFPMVNVSRVGLG